MRVGIIADIGSLSLKRDLTDYLRAGGYQMTDFSASNKDTEDEYPDFVIPLALAVACGRIDRGVAICGNGVGVSICANKIAGVRAAQIYDNYSAWQGVEEYNLNMICVGGRSVGPSLAWDLMQTFLTAQFIESEQHLRRLGKVALLEQQGARMPA